MSRHRWKHAVGVLVTGIAVVVVGLWARAPGPAHCRSLRGRKPRRPKIRSGTPAHFDRELRQIGKISPQEFARRYPAKANYLDKIDAGTRPRPSSGTTSIAIPMTWPRTSVSAGVDFRLNDSRAGRSSRRTASSSANAWRPAASPRCSIASIAATCRCSSPATRSCTPGTAPTTPCWRSWKKPTWRRRSTKSSRAWRRAFPPPKRNTATAF